LSYKRAKLYDSCLLCAYKKAFCLLCGIMSHVLFHTSSQALAIWAHHYTDLRVQFGAYMRAKFSSLISSTASHEQKH
jgi:hypothetical protein